MFAIVSDQEESVATPSIWQYHSAVSLRAQQGYQVDKSLPSQQTGTAWLLTVCPLSTPMTQVASIVPLCALQDHKLMPSVQCRSLLSEQQSARSPGLVEPNTMYNHMCCCDPDAAHPQLQTQQHLRWLLREESCVPQLTWAAYQGSMPLTQCGGASFCLTAAVGPVAKHAMSGTCHAVSNKLLVLDIHCDCSF